MAMRFDSKRALERSFLELLGEKEAERITVGEITERCGGSRQTFYKHYRDKYELINTIYLNLVDEPLQIFLKDGDWHKCVLTTHRIIVENREFFVRVNHLIDYISCAIDTMVKSITDVAHNKGFAMPEEDMEPLVRFYCRGGLETSQYWIRKGLRQTPEYMADLYMRSLPLELIPLLASSSARSEVRFWTSFDRRSEAS